jgi:hypothetical protein
VFPRDMVCLRNISVDTLHKGDTDDDDDDDDIYRMQACFCPFITLYNSCVQRAYFLHQLF